jgi:hypothetical protein
LGAGLLLPAGVSAQSITLGQVDTFESGTTQNWTNGHSGTGISVQLGGPAGAADHYLDITSSSSIPRLIVFNRSQWRGNYNAAGVNAIGVDLINFSATQLVIRVAFKETTSQFSAGFVSTVGFTLPPDSQWHHATFSLTDAAMTPINSPAETFSTLLGSASFPNGPGEVRILSSAVPALNGDVITARIGVDNIRASFIPVPEPAGGFALLLAAAGLAGPWLRRRCRPECRV